MCPTETCPNLNTESTMRKNRSHFRVAAVFVPVAANVYFGSENSIVGVKTGSLVVSVKTVGGLSG